MDLGSSGNLRELGSQRSTSALQDEVWLLQKLKDIFMKLMIGL